MNQRGMQAREELTGSDLLCAKRLWNKGIEASVELAIEFDKIKAHKQYGARGLEPYQMMKTVLTGTEFANFYHLRDDAAAQPEFQELASCMRRGMEIVQPQELYHSEYHLPYINTIRNADEVLVYSTSDGTILSRDDAIKISASCCAQVSYRKLDESLEKTIDVYNKLLGMGKKHASPFEHQATPMKVYENPFDVNEWEDGITHVSKNGSLWSGRFIGWIQERQLIPHTTVW
jgi:hypothetical protein